MNDSPKRSVLKRSILIGVVTIPFTILALFVLFPNVLKPASPTTQAATSPAATAEPRVMDMGQNGVPTTLYVSTQDVFTVTTDGPNVGYLSLDAKGVTDPTPSNTAKVTLSAPGQFAVELSCGTADMLGESPTPPEGSIQVPITIAPGAKPCAK